MFLDVARAQDFSTVRELVRANRALVNVQASALPPHPHSPPPVSCHPHSPAPISRLTPSQPSGRWTALHQAALAGDRKTVRLLCARGADAASDCFWLLQIASDCFRLLRIASDCFR